MNTPEIRYATTEDGVKLAYQSIGNCPIDIIYVPGCESNIELNWDNPRLARCLRRLASFSRLIVMDRRGTGCSDRLSPDNLPPLERQADDLRVVMDAVGSSRAALLSFDAGNILSAWFAAAWPERVTALVLNRPFARGTVAPDYPWAWDAEEWDDYLAEMAEGWGTRAYSRTFLQWIAPSEADDESLVTWFDRYCRQAASPAAAAALEALCRDTDIRGVLPSIRVPTLVLHHTDDPMEPVEGGRYVAGLIPAARFVELPGIGEPLLGFPDGDIDEIEEFLTGVRPIPDFDRILATVLFTDIVGSTMTASELGDAKWKMLLAAHDDRARIAIDRHRGTWVDSTGDGLLARFDGPARAVRCALAIAEAVRPLGIEIRAGCHTGEIELADGAVRGIAAHIGARVASRAGASEVWTSSTVKDLVAGSGLVFEDAGEHDLKGVPDRWHLYKVASS